MFKFIGVVLLSLLSTFNIFSLFSSVSIGDFEQVNVSMDGILSGQYILDYDMDQVQGYTGACFNISVLSLKAGI